MVKGKGKRSSSANEIPQTGDSSVSEPQPTPDMPQIDESAFVGLRQKIEQRLKDQSSSKGKPKSNKPNVPAQATFGKKEKETVPKGGKNQQSSAQGKKRDRNGEVIARDEKKDGKNKAGKSTKNVDEEETLRQEILALGGTEEDLDLLAGVDSESEVEGAPSQSKTKGGDDDLRKELSKMLEAAGHVVPDDLADDEVEDQEGEDEEEENTAEDAVDEDDSEPEEEVSEISDAEEAPSANKTVAKPKEPEVVIPKAYAKLVSDISLNPL